MKLRFHLNARLNAYHHGNLTAETVTNVCLSAKWALVVCHALGDQLNGQMVRRSAWCL